MSSFSKREKMPVALQPPEEPFDLVPALVHFSVVLPRIESRLQRRHNGDEAKLQRQLTRLVAFVGAVHDQVNRTIRWPQRLEQSPTLGRIVGLTGRQAEHHGRSSIRGNHMNLGVPSAS